MSTWATLEETRADGERIPPGADTIEGILDNTAIALSRVYQELDDGNRALRDVLIGAEDAMAAGRLHFLAPRPVTFAEATRESVGGGAGRRWRSRADVAVSADRNVYLADHGNDRIRRIDPAGVITTIAELEGPVAVETAPDGTLYAVAGDRVWRIDTSGTIPRVTPVAGGVTDPGDIAVGADGLLHVSSGAEVFAVLDDGTARPVVGTGEVGRTVGGEAGSADDTDLPVIDSIAFDSAGNLYLSHGTANQRRPGHRPAEPDPVALAGPRRGGGPRCGGGCAVVPA